MYMYVRNNSIIKTNYTFMQLVHMHLRMYAIHMRLCDPHILNQCEIWFKTNASCMFQPPFTWTLHSGCKSRQLSMVCYRKWTIVSHTTRQWKKQVAKWANCKWVAVSSYTAASWTEALSINHKCLGTLNPWTNHHVFNHVDSRETSRTCYFFSQHTPYNNLKSLNHWYTCGPL